MKPIAVFQHTEVGEPGSVVSILESLGREVRVIRVVDDEPVPTEATEFGGLVFMGGYMSVHDDFPWISAELALIRDADARGVSVAGHCLGSQLIALALGGSVAPHSTPEIGWQALRLGHDEISSQWWGEFAGMEAAQTFQWHGDTFQPPAGSTQIASAEHCSNQVFIIRDRHLLIQSHLEMTPALVRLYMQRNGEQLRRQHAQGNPAASDPADIFTDLDDRTARMQAMLLTLYHQWIRRCS